MPCGLVYDGIHRHREALIYLARPGRDEARAIREFNIEVAKWMDKTSRNVTPKKCPAQCMKRVCAVEVLSDKLVAKRVLRVIDQAEADKAKADAFIMKAVQTVGGLTPHHYGFKVKAWHFGVDTRYRIKVYCLRTGQSLKRSGVTGASGAGSACGRVLKATFTISQLAKGAYKATTMKKAQKGAMEKLYDRIAANGEKVKCPEACPKKISTLWYEIDDSSYDVGPRWEAIRKVRVEHRIYCLTKNEKLVIVPAAGTGGSGGSKVGPCGKKGAKKKPKKK